MFKLSAQDKAMIEEVVNNQEFDSYQSEYEPTGCDKGSCKGYCEHSCSGSCRGAFF